MEREPLIFTLTIRPDPSRFKRGRDGLGRTPEGALKRLLKSMLRVYGWRCVAADVAADEVERFATGPP